MPIIITFCNLGENANIFTTNRLIIADDWVLHIQVFDCRKHK